MEKILTIITVVFNADKSIENTILSVIEQKKRYKNRNIEYIIIDGKSTDNTIDIIKKYNQYIDFWISEPDKGIYDAMNKGIDIAKGEYIFFLGADDILLNLPLNILTKAKEKNINAVIGNVLLSNDKIFYSDFSWKLLYMNTIHHQGLFLQSKILKRYHFNTKYKVYADHDLNQKLYKKHITFMKVDVLISKFSIEGISGQKNLIKEIMNITYHNFGIWGLSIYILVLTKRFLCKICKKIYNKKEI